MKTEREQKSLRGLLVSLKELNIAGPADPERFVMEDGLTELLDGMYRYGVQIINLDMFQANTSAKVQAVLQLHQLSAQECLLVAASDQTLSLAKELDLATVGYRNPRIGGQKLSGAEILVEGFEEVDFYFLERMYQRRHNIPWTILETERCMVREMALEDLDALYEIYQGKNITRYMEGLYEDRKKEEEYTRAYIRSMYRFYGYGMWLAVEKSSGQIIGRVGLDNVNLQGEAILALGYVIGEPFQNQGYATELCKGILAYAASSIGFEEIYCLIHKNNQISIHLAKKLGFIWQNQVKIHGKTLQKYRKALYNVD